MSQLGEMRLDVRPNSLRQAAPSEVLDQAELVVLGIGHDDDDAFGVIVPLAGEPSAEGRDSEHRLINVLYGDVEMDADLAVFWLQNRLEYEPRLDIATVAEVHPAFLGRSRLAAEQGAPEPRHTLWVETVDCHTGPHVGHGCRGYTSGGGVPIELSRLLERSSDRSHDRF